MDIINICIILNTKFFSQGLVFLNSLFKNNSTVKFNIFLLYSSLDDIELKNLKDMIYQNGNTCTPIKVKQKKQELSVGISENYPCEVYYKLLLPFLLPETINKILYFDVDIIVNSSIKQLYDMDIENYSLAAVKDYIINKYNKKHKKKLGLGNKEYFNSGVVLFNINKIREIYSWNKIKDIINKYGENIKFPDQDILNVLFINDLIYLDEKYNYIAKIRNILDLISYENNKQEIPIIIHYAGIKPFNPIYDGKYYKIFWKYEEGTKSGLDKKKIEQVRKKKWYIIFLRRIYRVIFHVRR